MSKILKPYEICGPVNYILGNYILFLIKERIKAFDTWEFADELIRECEKPTATLGSGRTSLEPGTKEKK